MLTAGQVWWARVDRAAERKGLVGSKLMSDWARDVLSVISAEHLDLDLVGPFGHGRWQPVSPERLTDEYKQAETRRLCDDLGRTLGVGPMP